MQLDYAPDLTAREKHILREIVDYQDGIDRLTQQLVSDLSYYRARISACMDSSEAPSGLIRLYRNHVRHIIALLHSLRGREAAGSLGSSV